MKLLITGAFKYTNGQIQQLQSLGFKTIYIQDERKSLDIDVSDIDGIICNSLFQHSDISMFKELKFIQLTSAGVDKVPLDYIEAKDIKLFNAKDIYSIPMAEWVILKILEVYKKSKRFYELQLQHNWEKQRDLLELTDKKAAIIGFGSVGTEVAKRLKAFGVKIIGVTRKETISDLLDENHLIENIDELLEKVDIVVLTLPLNNDTRHLIDAKKISRMKSSSVIINVSRGSIIEERALLHAIQDGKFLGVVLDVFEKEPLSNRSPLWDYENVIITPHNSFVSDKVNERLFKQIKRNLKGVIKNDNFF
jgi:phosphoglycerate dehydrogenase-like enzyme